MEVYTTGSGIWGDIFAVPADVVDKYIKLAGAAQLKVLLWLLRNNSKRENITASDIGTALNMNPIDVKDCMEFWINVGLFSKSSNSVQQTKTDNLYQNTNTITSVFPEANKNTSDISAASKFNDLTPNNKVSEIKSDMNNYAPPKRTMSKAQKPDPIEVAQRISQDESFSALLVETEHILGRPLTHNDSSTLLMIHDQDGLPYEVITMILYFAKSENKLKMSYIESLGRDWGNSEIDTIEKAEEKINEIMNRKAAWYIVCQAFGLKIAGSPTKKQIEYADLWINQWGYDEAMLRTAYETCLNNRGEFNISYINGIIRKWHTNGIITEKDLADSKINDNKEKNISKENKTKSVNSSNQNTSYDINDFKKYDIFD